MSRKAVTESAIGWYPGSNRAVATSFSRTGGGPRSSSILRRTSPPSRRFREGKAYLHDDGLLAARWDEIHKS